MKKLSRKEAAKVLEDMKVKIEIPKAAVTQWERNTALDMAIEALKYSEVPNSSDSISRKAALKGLKEIDCSDGVGLSALKCDVVDEAVATIKALPTVDAVPLKHGRWVTDGIVMDDGELLMTRCTACGTPYEYGYDMPFCPNCGARMDGKDGEHE